MKNFLQNYFGYLGLVIYGILSVIIRIPVGLFLAVYIILVLIIWAPITGKDCCPYWVNHLYDWYCGK